jgi:hypothetical protein
MTGTITKFGLCQAATDLRRNLNASGAFRFRRLFLIDADVQAEAITRAQIKREIHDAASLYWGGADVGAVHVEVDRISDNRLADGFKL